jgi:hypothetical protein
MSTIQFDYAGEQQSAPINVDWATELGLFDCPSHEVDENLYPLRCEGAANSDPTAATQEQAHPLIAQATTNANPLLDTSAPAVGIGSLSWLLWLLVIAAAGALAYRFTPRSAPRD